MNKKISYFDEPTDFSLVQGGPLFQLLLKCGLLKPQMELLVRRIVVLVLIAWLPLLVLSIISGHAIGNSGVPFLYDLVTQVRLLLCIPFLLAAEVVIHKRIKIIVLQFLERDVISREDKAKFENIIESAMNLRNSVLAEIILLILAVAAGYWLGKRYVDLNINNWYMPDINDKTKITAAGWWYFFVSLTIFRFLLVRWYFRLFIWYRFLWQVARKIKLQLNALHPDYSGGLAFLSDSALALAPLLLAHTVGLSATFGNKIWHEGAKLVQFKIEITGWMIFLMALAFAPMFFFVFQLAKAKRAGLREYGAVASRYVREFRDKWIAGQGSKEQQLLGADDIQSLADLTNSFAVSREMRIIPFGWRTVLRLAILTIVPILPLVLTMIPLDELIDRALSLIF